MAKKELESNKTRRGATQNELLAFKDKENRLLFLTILHGAKAEYTFSNIKRKPVPKKQKELSAQNEL